MKNYEQLIIDLATRELSPGAKKRFMKFRQGQREVTAEEMRQYMPILESIRQIKPPRE